MKKNGVSLIALIIIIIIMLILATIVVFSSYDNVKKAKIGAFLDGISNIKDACETYYLDNKHLPTKEDSISKDSLKNLVDTEYQTILETELSEHGDTSSTFYEVDVSLPIFKEKGNIKEGRYYISTSTMTVYDLKGIKVNGKKYFSITNELSSTAKLNNEGITNNSSSVNITSSSQYSNDGTTNQDDTSPTISIDDGGVEKLENFRIIPVNVSDNVGIKFVRYQYLDYRYPSYTQVSSDEIVGGKVYVKMPLDVQSIQIEACDMSDNTTVISKTFDE